MNKELISAFKSRLDRHQGRYVELLKTLCDIPSGSEMTEGVNKVVDLVAEEMEQLGLHVRRVPAEDFGDHLVADTGIPGKQIVLGGHLDTTYTDYGVLPKFHIDGEHAVGPGTGDMKGGVVVFLAALDCLKEQGLLEDAPVTVILNSDEERGAPTSRKLFQEYSRNCRCALFSECAGENGELVVSRRGKLSCRLDVYGVGMHAGVHGLKVSALEAISHAIIAIEALREHYPDDSFNVGRAWGGIASNTIPAEASALFDVRFTKQSVEEQIKQDLQQIAGTEFVEGSHSRLTETSYRPVWERITDQSLFEMARSLGAELGQSIEAEPRGGTADVNWFGAEGIPSLDGLGPIGFDDHTPKERIVLQSLFDRALFSAALIGELAHKSIG